MQHVCAMNMSDSQLQATYAYKHMIPPWCSATMSKILEARTREEEIYRLQGVKQDARKRAKPGICTKSEVLFL